MIKNLTHKFLCLSFVIAFAGINNLALNAQTYQWAKSIGGAENKFISGIATDENNNVIVCGGFSGRADFDPSADSAILVAQDNDIFLAKYDKDGNYLWAVNIGGADYDVPAGIATGPNNHIYVTGVFRGTVDFDASSGTANRTAYGEGDIFLLSYDSTGQFRWVRQMGGTGIDNPLAVSVNGDQVYVSGDFQGKALFNPDNVMDTTISAGLSDIFLVKYDSEGGYLWAQRFGAGGYDGADRMIADDVSVIIGGTFGLTVDFNSSAGTDVLTSSDLIDVFLAKYSNDGDFAWARNIGGTGGELIRGLALDASGNIYMAGNFSDSCDMDPSDSVFMIRSSGKRDIFMSSLSPDGELNWAKTIGGPENDDCAGIDLSSGNEPKLYMTGSFRTSIDMDPSSTVMQLTSSGNVNDIFIGSYTSDGAYEAAHKMGGTGNDLGEGICIDNTGNILATGRFTGTVDFDPSSSTANLSVNGLGSDAFIAKYMPQQQPTSVSKIAGTTSARIYPNPGHGMFKLHLDDASAYTHISIYNSLGVLFHQQDISGGETLIHLHAPAGIYVAYIQSATGVLTKTFVQL